MNQEAKIDKNNDPVALIHALSHDGRGITTVANKTTFVSGALPGETITYRITRKHGTYNEAKLVSILQSSPERVTPPCQHFDICGGCSLQHMTVDTQIQIKQNMLLEQLRHFGKVEPDTVLPPLHAESLGYRRKARLGVKFVIKKDKLLMGFHEKSGSYVADIVHCPILHPLVSDHYDALKQLIASLDQYQAIPQVEIGIGDDVAALVIRHLKPLPEADLLKLTQLGQTHGLHIYLQPNAPQPVQKLWPADEHHRLAYSLPDHNVTLHFHPQDFTQINLTINRLMVNQAIALLDLQAQDQVLDLFCGIGNFTLPMARHAARVTGVEGTMTMVERANENAALNQLTNTSFYAANLMEPPKAAFLHRKYDKVLLDPPRAGAKEILPLVPVWGAKKIVYVSCHPATLARDAGILVHEHGYRLTHAGILNMFSHTAHIEAMAVFEIE